MSCDHEFTAEQVERSMHADAEQIRILRRYLEEEVMKLNCHVGRRWSLITAQSLIEIASDIARIFEVPVCLLLTSRAMDELLAGEV